MQLLALLVVFFTAINSVYGLTFLLPASNSSFNAGSSIGVLISTDSVAESVAVYFSVNGVTSTYAATSSNGGLIWQANIQVPLTASGSFTLSALATLDDGFEGPASITGTIVAYVAPVDPACSSYNNICNTPCASSCASPCYNPCRSSCRRSHCRRYDENGVEHVEEFQAENDAIEINAVEEVIQN